MAAPLILESWRDALRKAGTWDSWDQRDHILWITSDQISTPALHGLQLMRLLGRSDFVAWQKLVLALWASDSAATEFDQTMEPRDLPATIGLRVKIDSATRAREFFQDLHDGAGDAQAYEAQRVILEQAIHKQRFNLDNDSQSVDERIPIRFVVEYDNCSSRELPKLLQSVLEWFSTRTTGAESTALHQFVQAQFGLDQMSVTWISDDAKPDEGPQSTKAARAAAWNYNDGTLRISSLDRATSDAGGVLSHLVPPLRCAAAKVHLPHDAPPEMIPVYLSAVRFSPTVLTFLLELRRKNYWNRSEPQDTYLRRCVWQWLAFALYRAGARSKVHQLDISSCVLAEDVAAFREMLAAKNPLALLFGGDPTADAIGQISATHFQLNDPRSLDEPSRVWINSTPIAADVIHQPVGDMWEVLLPGYGRAWVQTSDVLHFYAHITLPQPHAITTVEFLDLDVEVDAQADLMEIIGGPVTQLKLCHTDEEGDIQPSWYRRTFAACPRLVLLDMANFCTYASNLAAIHRASAAGTFHLSELAVHVHQFDGANMLFDFITVLCNNQHPLTKSLKSLHLCVRMRQRDDVQFLNAIFDLLERNRYLATFKLEVVDNGFVMFMEEFFMESWNEHASNPGVFFSKLPIACKAAFLSALHNPHMSGVDSRIASLIFEFAGRNLLKRTVQLEYDMLSLATEPDEVDGLVDEHGNEVDIDDYSASRELWAPYRRFYQPRDDGFCPCMFC